jgi:hypothetical protein
MHIHCGRVAVGKGSVEGPQKYRVVVMTYERETDDDDRPKVILMNSYLCVAVLSLV